VYVRFAFISLSRPSSPSLLRLEAYREEALPLGPEVDLDGWKVFPSIKMHGILFHSRPISATVTFALATPLCYTRGSVIPCHLTVRCDDKQALDLFSSEGAAVVRMRRKVDFRWPRSVAGVNESGGTLPSAEERIPLSIAVWKLAQEGFTEDVPGSQRELYGELNLPRYLVPSFKFGDFQVKHVVDIHPFDVTGFVPDSGDRLFRTEIAIASAFADGLRPRAYLPPGYIADREGQRSL